MSQSAFLSFHDKIKLNQKTHESLLREKRDRVLTRLRNGLQFSDGSPLTFEWINRGSYEMGTGIKPIARDQDYDIDIGIILNGVYASHDAHKVKRAVFNVLDGHTASVKWKAPCITVQYTERGSPKCHVDVAVYVKTDRYRDQLQIAYGKSNRVAWEATNPKGLIAVIKQKSSGGERGAQFRRVVRYLKRWKDEHFPAEGNAAPIGIGLTVAAHRWFEPAGFGTAAGHDDERALRQLVQAIWRNFVGLGSQRRLRVPLPVTPYNDVFEKMSDNQMQQFYQRLVTLDGLLQQRDFRRAFGSDFPR